MAGPTPFEKYVNDELPTRVSTKDNPLLLTQGSVPVSTGVGLEVTFKDPLDIPGLKGDDGKSAYQIAVDQGFVGTEEQWIASLKGTAGTPGESAYEIAVNDGFQGTEEEWLASLKGANGLRGPQGLTGPALNIIATVDDYTFETDVKPYQHTIGDAWFVVDKLWVWEAPLGDEEPPVTGRWVSTGSLRGPDGVGLVIRGQWPNSLELPVGESNKVGDTYAWKEQLWSWMLKSGMLPPENPSINDYAWTPITRTGERGPQGIQGLQGPIGPEGPQGPEGKAAKPFKVVGDLSSIEDLPSIETANASEAYSVSVESVKHLFVFNDTTQVWLDLGPWQGPRGLQGEIGPKGDSGQRGPEGPAGADGKNLQVVKSVATEEDLLALDTVEQFKAVAVTTTNTVYVLSGTDYTSLDSWTNMGTFKGPQGDIGPQGPIGPEGPEGPAGKDGANGQNGTDIVITGSVPTFADLPEDPKQQDAYFVQDTSTLFVYINTSWVNCGTHRGPQGIQGPIGPEGPEGPPGKDGTNGTNGAQGPQGDPITIVAIIDSTTESPPTPDASNKAKCYVDQKDNMIYVNITGNSWSKIGPFQGPIGPKGDVGIGINIQGTLNSVSELPYIDTKPDLQKGDAYWVISVSNTSLFIYNGPEFNTYQPGVSLSGPPGDQGISGPPGPEGPPGVGLDIIYIGDAQGSPASNASNLGKAMGINTGNNQVELFVCVLEVSAYIWKSLGIVSIGPQGPAGPEGPQGPQGRPGVKGDQGPRGSVWVILPQGQNAPTSVDGTTGDWCLDPTGTIWYKASNWVIFTKLFPVPVQEVNADDIDKKMVRYQLGWVELPIDEVPSPVAGQYYARKKKTTSNTTEWVPIEFPVIPIGAVPSPVVDQLYVRIGKAGDTTDWVAFNGPKDDVTQNGSWVRSRSNGTNSWTPLPVGFNTYSLLSNTTPVSANITIDVANQQTYRLDKGTYTVTLNNGPVGRMVTAVFVVNGTAGTVPTFAGTLHWNDNTPIVDVPAGKVVITALWDGTEWLLAKGASY